MAEEIHLETGAQSLVGQARHLSGAGDAGVRNDNVHTPEAGADRSESAVDIIR